MSKINVNWRREVYTTRHIKGNWERVKKKKDYWAQLTLGFKRLTKKYRNDKKK